MKDYVDRLSDAGGAAERRRVTRNLLGVQGPNLGSMATSSLAGALFASGIRDLTVRRTAWSDEPGRGD